VLSRDKARREESWGKLEKAFQNNEKVQGIIFNQVKGGFTVDLDGAVAFLPRSQVDIRPVRDVGRDPFGFLRMWTEAYVLMRVLIAVVTSDDVLAAPASRSATVRAYTAARNRHMHCCWILG